MNSIDLTPIYRSSIGFDRLASMLEGSSPNDTATTNYPPYNIEMFDDNHYGITIAVAGFKESELNINVEKSVLTIRGKKAASDQPEHHYLHQGITDCTFERKFNLADYIEVTNADLKDGLLTLSLVKEIPEAMKPKAIVINQTNESIEKKEEKKAVEKSSGKRS